MEQTAVQLMSRKQRAAKLLTGDIGLTGLDALTEGEGGFEEALLEAIGRDEMLLNPSELFRKSEAQGEIDSEDAAYWNVELIEPEGEPLAAEVAAPILQIELQPALDDDPLVREALRLGGVVAEIGHQPVASSTIRREVLDAPIEEALKGYLDSVHIITDESKLAALYAELLNMLPSDAARLSAWLRDNRVVFPGCEAEVAAHVIRLTHGINNEGSDTIALRPVVVSAASRKRTASKIHQFDLLAVPEDRPEPQPKRQYQERVDETAPLQLALF